MRFDRFMTTRFGGLFFAWAEVRRFSSQQFWGGHPNTFRALFAWASLSIAGYMAVEGEAFNAHGYELMRFLATPIVWSAAFFVHWACITLVVLFGNHTERWQWIGMNVTGIRVGVQLFVNFYGFLIWSLYVVLQDLSFGHFAINASAERVLVLYSVWAFIRTGMNRKTDG